MVGKPGSLYMSKSHKEGLAALEWGLLHEPGNFTLLLGEVGTGKTTLIGVVLNRHYELARIAYITNPKLGFEEMLRVILEQLGYLPSATNKLELLKKVEWVLRELRPKERIAIFIDEAQALSDDTLEELRLFSNYAKDSKGHLEIMLVGQPELLTRLMTPALRQFHQRIGARAVLNRLRREESFEYIEHKLRDAGGAANAIFAKNALGEIVDRSEGIPRQLNLLCNNALIRAYAAGLRRVNLKVVRAAVGEYDNLATGFAEFHYPLVRPALRSIIAHPVISLASLAVISSVGLYLLGVTQHPKVALASRSETSTSLPKVNVAQKSAPDVSAVSHIPTNSETAPDRTATLSLPSSGPTDNEADKRGVDEAWMAPSSTAGDSVRIPSRKTTSASSGMLAYSVQSGDTIEGIALRHFGSKAKAHSVMKANPQLRDANRIYPGDTVFLPAKSAKNNESGTP